MTSLATCTSLCKKTLSFKWTINGAAKCLELWRLRSPCFNVVLKPATTSQPPWNSVWHLVISQEEESLGLCQGVHRENYPDYRDNSDFRRTVLVDKLKYYVLNPNTEEIVYPTDATDKHEYDDDINIDNADTIILSERKIKFTNYIVDDKLCVKVEANLFYTDLHDDEVECDIPPSTLHEDMYTLYKDGVLIDTVIKCDDKEFKVHRAILASQSPVFRAMFETDMKEKRSGIIEVSDITPAVMSDLVTYLYSGSAPNLESLVNELLDVAGKYQLPRLFKMCESELGKKMKETSVIETLILADLHGRPSLKKACLKYIRLNSAKVLQTSEWANFKDRKDQYASLIVEILENVVCTSHGD